MHKNDFLSGSCCGAIVLALAGFATPALADADAPDATNNQVIVVTGQQAQTAPETVPLNVAFSESTLTNEAIRNLPNDASLQTMLASQPSIFTYQNGPNGVGANIFFRGFNSGQFAETFDGLTINDVFNGGVTGAASTWNSVLFIPQNIDSVVLNRGINNPASNSYNSLGGTVDFLPKQPTDTFGANASASYGSFNSYTLNGSVNTGNLGGFKQVIQADYRKSDGWVANTGDTNLNLYYAGRHDSADGSSLSIIGVFNHNKGSQPYEMPVQVLQSEGGYGIYDPSVDYQQARDNEWMGIIDYKAVISPVATFENKVFAGGKDFLRSSYGNPAYVDSTYPLPDQGSKHQYWSYFPAGPSYNPKAEFGSNVAGNAYHFYGYTTMALGYSPKLTLALPHNTVTIGGNLTYGELHSREYWYGSAPVPQVDGYNDAWDEHDTRLLGSVYVQDEIRLLNDALTITPGLKYIYAKTTDSDAIGFYYPYGGSISDTEHFVAPTIGLNYKVDDHLAFNAAFGQNIKLPDISAYYNDVPGTTSSVTTPAPVTIKPEHVNDFELGARYKDGDFSASIDLYREDFSNIFVDTVNQSTYTTTVTNGGSARYQGVEVQAADTFHLGMAGDLKAMVNFAYNDAKYTSAFLSDSVGGALSNAQYMVTAGERMADVPQVLVSGGLTWSYQGFRLDAMGHYVGSVLILDDGTGAPASTMIPSHATFDFGASKTVQLGGGHNVKVSFFANNVFNKYYYNSSYVQKGVQYANPAAPRSVSGKIELAF
jgi:outer membrane receptor protein involved in Fe transport